MKQDSRFFIAQCKGFPDAVTLHWGSVAIPALWYHVPDLGACHCTHPHEKSPRESCLFSLPNHPGHRAQYTATLPHFSLSLQVKECGGSSKGGCVFIQQELPTCFICLHIRTGNRCLNLLVPVTRLTKALSCLYSILVLTALAHHYSEINYQCPAL